MRPRSICAVSSSRITAATAASRPFCAATSSMTQCCWEIARIVHEADLADERYDTPEAAGLDVLLRGLSLTNDDELMLELTAPLFDGLYEYKKRAMLLGREPS